MAAIDRRGERRVRDRIPSQSAVESQAQAAAAGVAQSSRVFPQRATALATPGEGECFEIGETAGWFRRRRQTAEFIEDVHRRGELEEAGERDLARVLELAQRGHRDTGARTQLCATPAAEQPLVADSLGDTVGNLVYRMSFK
jgi:hypothetical protein